LIHWPTISDIAGVKACIFATVIAWPTRPPGDWCGFCGNAQGCCRRNSSFLSYDFLAAAGSTIEKTASRGLAPPQRPRQDLFVQMLRVPVHKIEPGMVLARPIAFPNDPRKFLVQRDREVPPDLIPRLKRLGIFEVWIRQRNLEFLEDVIDEGLGERQREVYLHVRKNFESVMTGSSPEIDVTHFQSSISNLFDFLKQSSCGNFLLQKLDAFDNYLMSHSTNVCYMALLLGMKLERYLIGERSVKNARDAKDLQQLGLGCLLHDVGKMKIPAEILNKPGRLTPAEMEVMQLHPVYGHEMVKGRVPAGAAQVVLNHHQRYDGNGYPARIDRVTGQRMPPLAGKQIPIFSRIATVVDVYDAATSQRVYSAAKYPVQALHEMRTFCRGFFDPQVEQAFYQIIPPFPIGQVVTLSNGIEAAIVDFNPRNPVRPKVQGLKSPSGEPFADPSLEEIDLALHPDLQIAAIDSTDVRAFLETQESVEPVSVPMLA
jgi:HD-GYP domain-containing protein (c-di-GMP phosphodiesterase class II)